MTRFKHPQVCTANHLLSGEVVYLTEHSNWSRSITDAHVANTPDAAEALLATGTAQQDIIVGAYLADVELDGADQPVPLHFREGFRMRGPSNYFHGKQAEV